MSIYTNLRKTITNLWSILGTTDLETSLIPELKDISIHSIQETEERRRNSLLSELISLIFQFQHAKLTNRNGLHQLREKSVLDQLCSS